MPSEPANTPGLLAEFRRRRVFRVAVAYAAVAWLVIEITATVAPELLLPDWTTRAVILLLLLGFPIALVLAWAFDITPGGIRRTEPVAAETPAGADGGSAAPTPGTAAWKGVAAAFVFGALLSAVALVLLEWRFGDAHEDRADARLSELERVETLITDIESLIAEDRFASAYALAAEAEATLSDTSVLDPFWPQISDRLTVTSRPPGATVTAFAIGEDGRLDTEARPLGTTPLEDIRIARNPLLLEIELAGYTPVQRIASSALVRAGSRPGAPGITVSAELVPAGETPDGMVAVPGGEYALVTPDLPLGLTAMLDDFFIDRYEVDNAAFQRFIQAGGYRQKNLWPEEITADGEAPGFEAAMGRFSDRTGLSGPRIWAGQQPPAGEERHPVAGVSWYEASAYCTSQGKQLPTVFQWEKAARDGRITIYEGMIMPWGYTAPRAPGAGRANFDGGGTVPVDAYPAGISPYGAYAMAGNVKEWLANPAGNGRAVSGGSWEDPYYVFANVTSADPMQANATIGFRCARVRADDARRYRDQGSVTLDLERSTPVYEPVDEAGFRALLTHYRYDKRALKPQVLETVETPDWFREQIAYDGPAGERVVAYLWLPKSKPAPFQPLVYVPTTSVFFIYGLPESTERWMGPLVRGGRAVFAVLMKGMIGREWGPERSWPATDSVQFRDEMVLHATELRLGLDYLETRRDIDMTKLVYVGQSWGAGSRLVFAAVDDRYEAVVFVGGGIDERVKPTLPEADNINFAPYIVAPKLLVNGRQDDEHPWVTRGLPLWNLLSEPKQLALFDGAGHNPPDELRIPAITKFLDETIGPP